jgi:DNA-binding transcriptional ArsR family regulator
MEAVETVLRAIAEPHRREILRLVRDEELTAGQIGSHFEVSRPAVSQHLRILKDTGLVVDRRQGTKRFYRAHRDNLAALRASKCCSVREPTFSPAIDGTPPLSPG